MQTMYDRLREMTIRKLKPISQGGLGMECILKRKTMQYNPDTDMNEATVAQFNTSGIRATYKQFHIDGELIRQGDVKLYLCPTLTDGTACPRPQTTDEIHFGELGDYFIVTVKDWNYAGVDCGWYLQLRAA